MFDLQTLQLFSRFYESFNSQGYLVLVIIAFILRVIFKKNDFAKSIISIGGLFLAISCLLSFVLRWLEVGRAWYKGDAFEQFAFMNRAFGTYAWMFWTLILLELIPSQLLWIKRIRKNIWVGLAISIMAAFYQPLTAWIYILMIKMNQGEFDASKIALEMQHPFWTMNGIIELVLKIAAYLVIIFTVNWMVNKKLKTSEES